MSDAIVDAAAVQGDEARATRPAGPAGKIAFAIGATGLMLAMAADGIAVLGRHTGFPLLGAIEIVQAAIALIATSAMVSVTLARGHAAVHILTERLRPTWRLRLAILANVLAAITVGLLAAGSILLLVDLWGGFERSELLHVPLRWLRVLMVVALLLVAGIFVRHAVTGASHDA